MNRPLRIAGSVLAPIAVVIFCATFFSEQNVAWYESLIKPLVIAPLWALSIAWILMYVLVVFAMILMWVAGPQNHESETWSRYYFVQLLFGGTWVMFFFGFHTTLIALIGVILLDFIILVQIMSAWEMDRRVSLLLAPYLAFMIYISFLNAMIWYLN